MSTSFIDAARRVRGCGCSHRIDATAFHTCIEDTLILCTRALYPRLGDIWHATLEDFLGGRRVYSFLTK